MKNVINLFLEKSLKAPLFVIKDTAIKVLHSFLLFMTNPMSTIRKAAVRGMNKLN